MSHVYEVPIIPPNLGKQETIIQVAEVLDHLASVTDDLLKHINNRINSSSEKLAGVSERVAKVKTKITKLGGATNATQVFSSCKYPASDINKKYVSIFSDVKAPHLVRHKMKHKKVPTNDDTSEKLYIYHVKLKDDEPKENISGLGDIPNDVEFVNDLLLYNTGKNLYTNFVMSDALDVSQNTKERDGGDSCSIGAAPFSLSERSTTTRSSSQAYFYAPNIGEVPALDVPLDLPDLPNIADDLRYEEDQDVGIAPSAVTSPSMPDLPALEPQAVETPIEIELPPPPPPKEEPPPVEEVPPAPPEQKQEEPDSSLKVESPQLDVRTNLMEAIRQAGGRKKLKPAEVGEEKSAPKVNGGDLMEDLYQKLQRRRKGISGAKKQEGIDASTTMGKISAMIPPPEIRDKEIGSATEDEDWDD